MKNKLENILTIATKLCEIPESSTDDMLKKAYDSLEKIEKYVNSHFIPNLNTGIKN
jgi:hypothetical protein